MEPQNRALRNDFLCRIHRIPFDNKRVIDTILPISPDFYLPIYPMNTPCKHPKVRVVAREEDVEYVECLDCGEVFDSNEFQDMAIEESVVEDEEE
jgi:Zn ribbon nucleic-acid-binding protein